MIYADNAATTKLSDAAAKTIIEVLNEYANPSQPYSFSRKAKERLADARYRIAKCINADPSEIYFTSGGSESNNWVIKGFAYNRNYSKAPIITSAIEHHSVLRACESVESSGCPVAYLMPNKNGVIEVDTLRQMITKKTGLVSVMMVNNEIGTIQPIKELCQVAHNNGALFHTDAVQAVGHLEVDVKALGVDMLSSSAHKFNGPKGVGFLYIKKGTSISPLINGGSQESGHRAGTENVAYIAGMAVALDENIEKLNENQLKIKELRKRLISQLRVLSFSINGSENGIDNILSLSFPNQSGEAMLHKLDLLGVMISTGSACDSKETQVSHVIKAIHLPDDLAEGTIRISLSSDNTLDEMDTIAEKIKRCCNL